MNVHPEARPAVAPKAEPVVLPMPARNRAGYVVAVSGCKAVVALEPHAAAADRPRLEIGALANVRTAVTDVVGVITALNAPGQDTNSAAATPTLELMLVGELARHPSGRARFSRGVAHFPTIGDAVVSADRDDLASIFLEPGVSAIDVGALYHDASVPARLFVDELFSKHFIVVGATGCGKSSALICILQQVLASHEHAHIVVLDIHGEYQTAFGALAELVNPANLHVPFWLLNFQELCEALTTPDAHHDAEIDILADAILASKRRYFDGPSGRVRRAHDPAGVTIDAPTPFRLSDVVAQIDEQMGRLERMHATLPYRRLKNRIETLATDTRYAFMFGNPSVEDTMADILGRVFRVPSQGRPITVIDLAAVPPEILDVLVSLISRLAYDLAVWSEGQLPILIVCEEAHRYVPCNTDRFVPTRQALARIAKEGRKYGVSLALITQRPSDLDSAVLSQCGTVVAMRLSTDRDQDVVRAYAHDSVSDLFDFLPLLADREAIVLGQGVAMPVRIRFKEVQKVKSEEVPGRGFSDRWKNPNMDRAGLENAISRWRLSGRNR